MPIDSIQAIRLVAERLGPLVDRVVFLGGATVGLLAADPGGAPPRATKDVDLIVEVMSRWEYQGGLRDELLRRGFREKGAEEDGSTCRWIVDETKVDIMPTKEEILGFKGHWYPAAFAQAVRYIMSDGLSIRLVTAPCFLATKLEAFNDRGRNDYPASPDVEDIVAVVDGRASIKQEIEEAALDVREYVSREIARHLEHREFVESLPGHLAADRASQERLPGLTNLFERIARIS